MMIDRRGLLGGLAVSAGLMAVSGRATAAGGTDDGGIECSLVVDAASARVHHRNGPCERRFTPASTFKIPLAVMGFEAGILIDAHSPRWEPVAGDPISFAHDKGPIDPTAWEALSVVWYSQHLTRRLGFERFRGFVEAFDYGNRDVSGNPGKNDGLTRSWLSSSLAISADEQVGFLRRLIDDRLPVSAAAQQAARSILPVFSTAGGWTVHGKTGSGRLTGDDGKPDPNRPTGWFVGWAERADRRVIFARLRTARDPALSGLTVRASLLADLDRLAGD